MTSRRPSANTQSSAVTHGRMDPCNSECAPAALVAVIPPMVQNAPLDGSTGSLRFKEETSELTWARIAPGPTTIRLPTTGPMALRPLTSTMTAGPTAPPDMLLPEPRGISGVPVARDQRTSATTSSASAGTATASGVARAMPAASAYTARAGRSSRKIPRNSEDGRSGRINGIVVEPAPRLPTKPSRQHHATEQRRRRKSGLAILVEHDLGDSTGRVDAHEIEERQRAHRVPSAEPHGIVDVDGGTDTRLDRAHGIEHVRDKQPVHYEPGCVLCHHRLFAGPSYEVDRGFDRRRARPNGRDHLGELHHRDRIEKVQANEPVRPAARR